MSDLYIDFASFLNSVGNFSLTNNQRRYCEIMLHCNLMPNVDEEKQIENLVGVFEGLDLLIREYLFEKYFLFF